MSILIVEDSELVRRLMTKLCEAMGFSVKTANDGSEALQLAKQEFFEVILMDIVMPGLDGLECTRSIRALELYQQRRPRIVGISATASAQECLENGMDAFIPKPATHELLRSAILGDMQL